MTTDGRDVRFDGPLPKDPDIWKKLNWPRFFELCAEALAGQAPEVREAVARDPGLVAHPFDDEGYCLVEWQGEGLARIHWSQLIVRGQG